MERRGSAAPDPAGFSSSERHQKTTGFRGRPMDWYHDLVLEIEKPGLTGLVLTTESGPVPVPCEGSRETGGFSERIGVKRPT